MIEALQNLLMLQEIEFGKPITKAVEKQIEDLRAVIPAPILGHYDRLRARDKKGIVALRNQVCTGCHMTVPIGTITVMMRQDGVYLCDNCGRYLYLPKPAESASAQTEALSKPPEKRRRRKTLTPAA